MNEVDIKKDFQKMIAELLPILKGNSKNNDIPKALSSYCNNEYGNSFHFFSYSEIELFDSQVKFIVSLKNVSEYYSREYVEKALIELYHKILANESKLSEYIEEFLNFFSKISTKDYLVASGIENIRLGDDLDLNYEIINSVIKIARKEDFPTFPSAATKMPHGNELLNKPAIFTGVKAAEATKAKELALHNFIITFNLLRLYAPQDKPVLKGCLLSGNQDLFFWNQTEKSCSSSHSTVGELLLNCANLNDKYYKQLRDLGLDELRKENSISKIVKECLYWYGLGLDEKHPSAKLLNFVTVLESVLKRKGETAELRRTVSERGAILLHNEFDSRKNSLKQLKQIYDIRSKVVHTGVLLGDKDLSAVAGSYARAVLIKIIKKSKEFNGDFDKFIGDLDDLLLSGLPRRQDG